MKICEWFWAMEGNSRAVFLSRFAWLAALGIAFIGLLPTGWMQAKYRAADSSVVAHYGLWKVDYMGTGTYQSNYQDWLAAQPEGSTAYGRIQVRPCVYLGCMWMYELRHDRPTSTSQCITIPLVHDPQMHRARAPAWC